ESQAAKECPADQIVAGRLQHTPQRPSKTVQQAATMREKPIGPLGHGRKTRHVFVCPPPESALGRITQYPIGRGRAGINSPVGFDMLNRVSKIVRGNGRIVWRRLLIGAIPHSTRRESVPIANPLPAYAA